MYFPDLSLYTYSKTTYGSVAPTVNIGWLQRGFSRTSYDSTANKLHNDPKWQLFLSNLKTLSENPVNKSRGQHDCDFCVSLDQTRLPNGNGEVRVAGRNGIIYAAPALIYHYVKEHEYFPPQVFIDAVYHLDRVVNVGELFEEQGS